MIKQIFILFTVLAFNTAMGQSLRIGVLRDHNVKKIQFSAPVGAYLCYADSIKLPELGFNEFYEFSFEDPLLVRIRKGAQELGAYKKVFLVGIAEENVLTLTTKIPAIKVRKYEGNFEISATDRELQLINLVQMDHYLSGVVECEGGGKKHLEYYKVQAIMSRTYALENIRKHADEGFDLCDRVHCQAYHSMNRFTPEIEIAVIETHGMIMVDDVGNFAQALFHANCGGQTCLPEHVWSKPIPYLNSFKDTFCIYTKQSHWEKRISKAEWRSFLVNQYQFPEADSVFGPQLYHFESTDRSPFYVHQALGIPMRDLRTRFHLKSTYFSVYEEGNDVLLKGRGFGHGVGLCQEGAMKMATYDFTADQIIRFYFPGVQLIDLDEKPVTSPLAQFVISE